jgi:hypothetical protein
MSKIKATLAIGVILLFLGVAMIPASASILDERYTVNRFFDEIEGAALKAHTFSEFVRMVIEICKTSEFTKFPILQTIISFIINWIMKERSPLFSGKISDLFGNSEGGLLKGGSTEHFVISRGSYNRLRQRKQNTLFKQGFGFVHYFGGSNILKDKTTIMTRHPFGLKQREVGSHIVLMLGFKGLFLDVKSKLTGNAYTLIMGRATRARAFDLRPLSD